MTNQQILDAYQKYLRELALQNQGFIFPIRPIPLNEFIEILEFEDKLYNALNHQYLKIKYQKYLTPKINNLLESENIVNVELAKQLLEGMYKNDKKVIRVNFKDYYNKCLGIKKYK